MGWLADQVAPPRCCACSRPARGLCNECARSLVAAPPLAPPPHIDRCVSLLSYDAVGRDVIAALKFRNHRDLLSRLGRALALACDQDRARSPGRGDATRGATEAVTWVPTTRRRMRARGYDQAELLARAVAPQLGLPVMGLLDKTDAGHQTGSSRVERESTEFVALRPPPARVLLIDDVRTTGSSLSRSAVALREAGTLEIRAATVAAVP